MAPGKGTIETVPGHSGEAVKLSFPEHCKSVFATARIVGNEAWDQAEGFSFWLKGDGSSHLGGLQVIWNEDYALRYDYAFSLKQTEWRKVTVAWRDLVPALPAPGSVPLDVARGNAPSKLSQFWFGKWWYWRDDAAHSYAIDEIRLEAKVPRDEADYRPAGAPLAQVAAKVKAGQPITVVTMGDSLTDVQHWTNRTTNWPLFLKTMLAEKSKVELTVVNPAFGGTQLRQNVVLIPGWTATTPTPDLVTICFGYNDWDAGMRGPMFREAMIDAVERIRRATGGKSDVLIMTTAPSLERWTTVAELAQACRDAARESNAGLADLEASFHSAGDENRATLYASDKTHLSSAGQEIVATTVLETIANPPVP
jgi:lysophospholipase L1-like esterase